MSVQSLPPEGSARRDWSLLLAIVIAYSGVVASWTDLGGKATIAAENHAAQGREIDKLKEDVDALEKSRALEDKLSALSERIAKLEATINELRGELRPRRR